MEFTDKERRLAGRRVEEATDVFQQRYAMRSGIETDQADSTSSDRWCEATGAGYDRRRRAA